MADDKKMFLCIKNGLLIHITPQTRKGWRAVGIWMLPLIGLMGLSIWASLAMEAQNFSDGRIALWVALPTLLLSFVWAFGMIRWMYLRSDVITAKEIEVFRRQRRASSKRGR